MNEASAADDWTGKPPTLAIEPGAGRLVLRPAGDWTIRSVGAIEAEVDEVAARLAAGSDALLLDLSAVGRLDTAGALFFHRIAEAVPDERRTIEGLDATRRVLCDEVAQADRKPPPPALGPGPVICALTDLGRLGFSFWRELREGLTLLGGIATVIGRTFVEPRRMRFIPFVHQVQRTTIDALPIIALMSFLIGCIIAQQGAFYFRRFGADIYVVDMVGVLTLREIAVILTAVMVAGRSGSAFTAELGSMKMREEIDALKVTGLDPVEVLVVPRVLALMLALPILVFVADLAAIFGAAIVCNAYADIPTATFLNRLHGAVGFKTFFVGVTKAPFMAMIIAMVSCLEGLQVAGSAESLGRHTTMAVVKSIFIVILVDGIFAMFYAAVGV